MHDIDLCERDIVNTTNDSMKYHFDWNETKAAIDAVTAANKEILNEHAKVLLSILVWVLCSQLL